MTVRAAEAERAGCVHRGLVGLCVAGDAACAFLIGFFLRLADQIRDGLLIGGMQRKGGQPQRKRDKK
jgi:hypothetical protein